jgi:hypothetical protein
VCTRAWPIADWLWPVGLGHLARGEINPARKRPLCENDAYGQA